MVTGNPPPAALTLPLPAHARAAARDLAHVHRVSLRAVLLAASMYAGQQSDQAGRRPLDKGRLVRDAETFLSRTSPGTSQNRQCQQDQRYTSDSGDILIRVAEDPADHTFRVELIPLSARIPADRQWRVWNRLVTFLQAPPSDLSATARRLAARAGDAVAIEDDHDRFTYGDLVQLADAAAGLGAPGDVVGVLGCASARLWATVFALYDAGLTYVPLDARLPAQQLESMARAACCSLVVDTAADTRRRGCAASPLAASLSALAPVLTWKQLNDLPCAPDAEHRRTTLAPEQVAYITFTTASSTGSTAGAGAPKGVQVPRRALARLATWGACELDLTCGTVVSQAAEVGFFGSAWELWPALLVGAHVKVVPEEVRADAAEFSSWLLTHRTEVAFAPTPVADRLMASPWPAGTALRVLACCGDLLHPIPAGLPFGVLNLYGPAQCPIVAAAAWVEPGDAMPPIGHVLPHLYHRVVNDNGTPVPPGGAGELWLGGPGLPLGYAGLPNETAERFISDPHSACAQHVYRTGDIVRERPDGRLDLLGRRDRQLKIVGARVEQSEAAVPALGARRADHIH